MDNITGRFAVFFYVLNKNTNDNCYHGKNHDKYFIVSHLHHLLSHSDGTFLVHCPRYYVIEVKAYV